MGMSTVLARVVNIPGVHTVNRIIVPGGDYIKVEPPDASVTLNLVYLDMTTETITVQGTVQLSKRVAQIIIPESEKSKFFVIEVGRL
jgi:hypothetical protein